MGKFSPGVYCSITRENRYEASVATGCINTVCTSYSIFYDSVHWLSNSKAVHSEETYHVVSDRLSQKIADIDSPSLSTGIPL